MEISVGQFYLFMVIVAASAFIVGLLVGFRWGSKRDLPDYKFTEPDYPKILMSLRRREELRHGLRKG